MKITTEVQIGSDM
jgi:hypothetical protein